jgi:integrase
VYQKHRQGCERERCACPWWISYRHPDGRRIFEPAESNRKGDAQRLLQKRVGAKANNLAVIPHAERLTVWEASQAVIDDFEVNKKRGLPVVRRAIDKHLRPYFGDRRMAGVTTADVTAYIAHRQREGIVAVAGKRKGERIGDVSNGQINRELALLKRTFSLAVKSGKLAARPHIPMLAENNARSGFFEPDQLAAVLAHLPTDIQPVIEFAAMTGWRIASEVLPLEWRQVDFDGEEVRLDAGTTKNKAGRVFPFTAGLRALLRARNAEREKLKKAGVIVPWVFWRMVAEGRGGEKKPRQIVAFGKSWTKACRDAGCPGRLPHDLRRTAVRNLTRAGVPQTVAMKLSGHKTDSVFRRYDIVSPNDLRVAVERLDAAPPAASAR